MENSEEAQDIKSEDESRLEDEAFERSMDMSWEWAGVPSWCHNE